MTAAMNVAGSNDAQKSRIWRWLSAVFALALIEAAAAQGKADAPKATVAPAVGERVSVDVLKGTWVRPDGGYTIAIRSIGPDGRIEATYFNPSSLPFAKAQTLTEGKSLRVFFELQAGGYAGSTYELTYDPASDRLRGTYYQAVVKQKFDVTFLRK
jgi:hypothetical protein